MYVSEIPTVLIALFIVTLAFPLLIYGFSIKSAGGAAEMNPVKIRKVLWLFLCFFIGWLTFASILALNGWLYGNSIPPKPILFLILPFTLFLFLIVKKSAIFKNLFGHISIETLINIHIFRLIGGWFLILSYHDLLPYSFAARTGWGDIITGISALLVTYFVFKKKVLNIKWAYVWNIFGLLDILTVVISAITLTLAANSNPSEANNIMELTMFPFALIPAFAPASIVFLHIITFKKLNLIRSQNQ